MILAGVRISQTYDVYPVVPDSNGVEYGAVKCVRAVMCLLCFGVSLQKFTAHSRSAEVCPVAVLHVAVT
jgi:hypothetical protein